MSSLVERATGRVVPLAARTLVGRDPVCLIRVDHPRVSREHALLRWDQGAWWVRDLASRNGTRAGADRLAPQVDRRLLPGEALHFGGDEVGAWALEAEGPPQPFARRIADGHIERAVADYIELRGEGGAVLVVCRDARRRWVCEEDGLPRPVQDGALVEVDGLWRLELPDASSSTVGGAGPRLLARCTLRLRVSRDGEHVSLELDNDGDRVELGERQHWYVLWVMVRARLADAAAAEHDQGWLDMDRLARLTGIERRSLDTYLSRARRDLAAVDVLDAAQLVAARPNQRRVGLPPAQLVIEQA
jgi:hypothetical protein